MRRKSRDSPMKLSIRVVRFNNEGVFQAVTLAYFVY